MKANQFRDLNTEELNQKIKGFKKELFDLNAQKRIGTVEKPARFKSLKQDIARIMTILKEREKGK
ncbi:MAG: 50S ribosomal protein L29 [Candidatus Omnitrophica bacterium]|nr:50S ribosomal protein L29 [Candidatus Omnitrophota bacterium]